MTENERLREFLKKSTSIAFNFSLSTLRATIKIARLVVGVAILFSIIISLMISMMFMVVPTILGGGLVAYLAVDKETTLALGLGDIFGFEDEELSSSNSSSGSLIGTWTESKSSGEADTEDGAVSTDNPNAGAVIQTPTDTTYMGKLQAMAEWYFANVGDKYSQATYISCPLLDGLNVREDCSGFATAYMNYVSGARNTPAQSNTFVSSELYAGTGWVKHRASEFSDVSQIPSGSVVARKGHVEIFVDATHTFGWGDKPSNKGKEGWNYPRSAKWSLSGGNLVGYGNSYPVIYVWTGS